MWSASYEVRREVRAHLLLGRKHECSLPSFAATSKGDSHISLSLTSTCHTPTPLTPGQRIALMQIHIARSINRTDFPRPALGSNTILRAVTSAHPAICSGPLSALGAGPAQNEANLQFGSVFLSPRAVHIIGQCI
jgi:hypothetical protein